MMRPSEPSLDFEGMSFLEHFAELRLRLIRVAWGLAIGMLVCYAGSGPLLEILLRPLRQALGSLGNGQLVVHTVTEGVSTYIVISLVGGLVLSAPNTFFQIWRFVAPGLTRAERRLTIPFVIAATTWFAAGVAFGFAVIFPILFPFFLGMSGDAFTPMLSIYPYVLFSMQMLAVFGVLFELPVATYFLTRIGIVEPEMLTQARRFSIVIAFILAAVLAPEPVTQTLLAVPLIVLYELGVLSSRLAMRSRTAEDLEVTRPDQPSRPDGPDLPESPSSSRDSGLPSSPPRIALESSEGLVAARSLTRSDPWW